MATRTMFFKDCKTLEDVKETYRKLCKQHHPDNGGDAEVFKKVTSQYTKAFERLKTFRRGKEGAIYTKETDEKPEEFMNAINSIIHLQDINIEVCGTWVWVSGNTKECHSVLKNAGYMFAGKKKMWFWHSKSEAKSPYRGHTPMNRIRAMYGSQKVENVKAEELGAVK